MTVSLSSLARFMENGERKTRSWHVVRITMAPLCAWRQRGPEALLGQLDDEHLSNLIGSGFMSTYQRKGLVE